MSANQTHKTSGANCPVCGSDSLNIFFETRNVPVHCNLLWESRENAINCPKGDIKLAFCPVCTFITNIAFRQENLEYSESYDTSLHFSPYFKEYAQQLATRLIERHDLHGKDVLEIGCGKGFFLSLLCRLGNNRGVGFDPAYSEQADKDVKARVEFIPELYSERHRGYKADLIVCRHVLEHIPDPKDFIETIRRSIGELNSHIFFEVPNALHTLKKLAIWDIIYEHCSYFTPISLSLVLSSCGFSVTRLTEEFEGQYLCIEAAPTNQNTNIPDLYQTTEIRGIARDIAFFTKNTKSKLHSLRKKLEHMESTGQQIVVWGAGSKGVTFLNTYKELSIEYAVDINPNKQGKHIPGTGQLIIPPESLLDHSPDVIIIMNPIYKNEIQEIVNSLNISVKFMYV